MRVQQFVGNHWCYELIYQTYSYICTHIVHWSEHTEIKSPLMAKMWGKWGLSSLCSLLKRSATRSTRSVLPVKTYTQVFIGHRYHWPLQMASGVISKDFSLRLMALCQPVLSQRGRKSSLNDITQPVDNEEEGRSPTTDREWLKERSYAMMSR